MQIGAILVLTAAAVLTAAPAHAYIDPGTGGMLSQIVTGGVAGLLVLLRLYWSRIADLFRRSPSPGAAPGTPPPARAAEHDRI